MKGEPWFAFICTASKRVENILKKVEPGAEITESLLAQEQEIALYKKFKEIEGPFIKRAEKGEYAAALKLLSGLKEPIDSFFDKVLVMTEDVHVRRNRIALLSRLVGLFGRVARFSSIAQT
jgi:glycyl-tRNA synthetase beta chain